MALRQSKQILAGYPVPNPISAVDCIPITADFLVPTAGLALNDVIEMGGIAEGMVVVDAMVACEDLDTGATLTIQAGIVSGVYGAKDNARTCGAEFFPANAIGQTGGVARLSAQAGLLLTPSLDIVPFGLKIVAAPAGNIVGAKIRMTVWARPAPVSM